MTYQETNSDLVKIYLIGSLRNEQLVGIGMELRKAGFDVFDDWISAGPEADDYWQKYETQRGHSYEEALQGYAATHVFEFDKKHLEDADLVVLVGPAGKSGHLELGWALGKGKPGYILLDAQAKRFDVMYRFATKVVSTVDELLAALKEPSD